MVSTRKRNNREQGFSANDLDFIIGVAVRSGGQIVEFKGGQADRDFLVITNGSSLVASQNALDVQTFTRIFTDKITKEMSNVIEKVEDRIQNANYSSLDNFITPRIELTVSSTNAQRTGGDIAGITASSERGEQVEISAPFGNVFDRNSTLRKLNWTDETWRYNPDEINEFPVSEACF